MSEMVNKGGIVAFSLRHYKLVAAVTFLVTILLGALIGFIKVDTDPENMLDAKEAVRLFHDQTKAKFNLNDIVVLGIVNEKDPNGVFNVDSLRKIYDLTEFAKTLRWDSDAKGNFSGVIEVDVIAPSLVDHISNDGQGVVKFQWLMPKPPQSQQEALAVRDKALSNPLLKDTLVSSDGRALCLYLPLTSKNLSYKVYKALKSKIAEMTGDEKYHITGLPVAEDTFGVEMFIQMAISAPLAMLTAFVLMFIFFRKITLVIPPMLVAMVSVITTMGLLIGFGFPVHIMSSMIPIFLMPISVVDSVHILSEFFDRYTKQKGRAETVKEVMKTLFTPMLYTSLTSAAGFASLSLTPIPPVQVFGVFVAIGVMIAWLCTVTLIPASVMFIREKSLENFGLAVHSEDKQTFLTKFLHRAGKFTYDYSKPILVLFMIVIVFAIYGISRIKINDNPIKWFAKSHPIRQADIELNKHFGGTYMAYLVLNQPGERQVTDDFIEALKSRLDNSSAEKDIVRQADEMIDNNKAESSDAGQFLLKLSELADEKSATAADTNRSDQWYDISGFFAVEAERLKPFKNPAVLKYISSLQDYLKQSGFVGKSNSVADVVKKVHKELIDGRSENEIIPDSLEKVAQCLLQFQSSHRPEDLWHLVSSDYKTANIWIQLRSGDNRDMNKVVRETNKFFKDNPPPVAMEHNWAGLTYINVVWQDKMVYGMLQSFAGSFLVVFIMMAILFRSALWGALCMVPLTITILFIYAVVGAIGKDYDMPVAVLSALTLGMAVDFAIHFLERGRSAYLLSGSWKTAAPEMFGEPARAITRNVLVIAIGFLPLLAAPLVPYKTVGIFMCAIMGISGLITLFVLPALMKIFEKRLFKDIKEPLTAGCNCGFCLSVSIAAVLLIAVNAHQYWHLEVKLLSIIGASAILISAVSCGILSRRKICKILEGRKNDN
ncbi:MAG: MMPL family transporter [Phycisphaerae bacterium]|nr:MMPL family transporter [Phycisphaerae bacterium]